MEVELRAIMKYRDGMTTTAEFQMGHNWHEEMLECPGALLCSKIRIISMRCNVHHHDFQSLVNKEIDFEIRALFEAAREGIYLRG